MGRPGCALIGGLSMTSARHVLGRPVRSRIGIRELRDTLTATIRRVRSGETLEVTHDGEPVAIPGAGAG